MKKVAVAVLVSVGITLVPAVQAGATLHQPINLPILGGIKDIGKGK